MPEAVTEHFKLSMPAAFCHHFSRLLQCRVYYLNADNSIRCAFASGKPTSHSDDGDLLNALFHGELVRGRPVIKSIRPGESYVAVNLFENDSFYGRLAAGPIMSVAEYGKTDCPAQENYENAASTAILLYHFVYGEWADENELLKFCTEDNNAAGEKELKKSVRLTRECQKPVHHHSVAYEDHILNLISEGNESRLLEMIKDPPDGAYGLLDREHPLRNIKDDCICSITLAARAAVAGGLDSETAFSLSDESIQNLEYKSDIESLYVIMEYTLRRYAQLVAEIKHLNYSYRINRCRSYILNHIYEKLTVSTIASELNLSPEYLSAQFRKETGTRLVDFIQEARAEEAKKLLLFTDSSILEIASILNYHDQSHFTKSFKNVFGVTPGYFRNGNSAHKMTGIKSAAMN